MESFARGGGVAACRLGVGPSGWVAGRGAARGPSEATDARCSTRAGGGSTRSTSIARCSATWSCERWRPGTATSWPRSRSRSAERSGDARRMLWWIERWRATALDVPHTRAAPDEELDRQVAALRDVARRLDAADGPARSALRQERDRLEAEVRRTHRRQRADGTRGATFDPAGHPSASSTTRSCVVLDVPGRRPVGDHRGRRAGRRRQVGPLQRRCKRRGSLGSPCGGPRSAGWPTSPRLPFVSSAALLGEHPPDWSGRRVVLVPPADLLTAPWGLLPVFGDATADGQPFRHAVGVGSQPSDRGPGTSRSSPGQGSVPERPR